MQMYAQKAMRGGGQEAARRWDLMAAWATPPTLSARRQLRRAGARGQAAGSRLGGVLVSLDGLRFFECAAHASTTAACVARNPESRQIISKAYDICQGRFDLLGIRGLD